MFENDSMIEIAVELMEKKRKPHTIQSLAKEVFEMKGLKVNENKQLLSQFINDFMLCGSFICCGEDKKGNKVWDIKSRQHHELLDRDGAYLEDPYDEDEDVLKNELKDDFDYTKETTTDFDSTYTENDDDEDEDDDKDDEKDDIEEELLMNEEYFGDDVEEDKYDDDEDSSDDLLDPKKK